MSMPDTSATHTVQSRFRASILEFEHKLAQIPGAVKGDTEQCPLRHSFGDGIYMREIFIPKGYILTGKIHKHSHPNFLLQGEALIATENGGTQHYKAPMAIMSEPGIKRAIIALSDLWWITVHVTDETDLEKVEEHVIAKTYEEYEKFRGSL